MEYLDDAIDVGDLYTLLKEKRSFIRNMKIVGFTQGKRWWSLSLQDDEANLTLRGLVRKTRKQLNERQAQAQDAGRVGATQGGDAGAGEPATGAA